MKKIAILGSTGSVGTSALEVIRRHPESFKVVGLTARTNASLLARQARKFKPRLTAIADVSQYNRLRSSLGSHIKVMCGDIAISEVASMKEADIVLLATSGTSAITPLIEAIKSKKRIALANKESIVSAGNIIKRLSKKNKSEIIPVDSEHSSIFQCLRGETKKAIDKIYLMGSGGPLKDVSQKDFSSLKPKKVLKHPVWKMGRKITIDSATMMNKGLEVIEASYLFDMDISKIEILLHPEALIHSMVSYKDGNIMANLFYPDMKIPIHFAFSYPNRKLARLPVLDISKVKTLSFKKPDKVKFPAINLCYEAARSGGTYPACLNAANEEAVFCFLNRMICFTDIVRIVKKVLKKHKGIKNPNIRDIFLVDAWAKEEVKRYC